MLLAQSLKHWTFPKRPHPPSCSTPFLHYGSCMVFSPFLEHARPALASALVHLFSCLSDCFLHPVLPSPAWNQPQSGAIEEDPADSQIG